MKSFRKSFLTYVKCLGTWVVGIIIMLHLGSCEKEEELPSPRIFIDNPVEQQLIQSLDTVLVRAQIEHTGTLQWVEVELVDLEYRTVSAKQRYTGALARSNFEGLLIMDMPLMEGGAHYVAVRANDGRKTGSGFKRVQVSPVPRKLDRVLMALRSSFNISILAKEAGEAWETLFGKAIDCRGVALNYRQNILATVGGETGNLDFHEMEEYSVVNSLQGFGTPSTPFFLGVQYDRRHEEFQVLMREPRLRVYDKSAMPSAGFELIFDHIPSAVFAVNDHYYTIERPIGIPSMRLVKYTRIGVRLSILEVEGEVKGMFARNEGEIFVWENHPDGCKLRMLSDNSQLIADIFQRPGESLEAVVQIQPGIFLFLTDQGLYRYNYSNGGTVPLGSHISGQRMYYEPLDQLLYVSNGEVLDVLTTGGQLLESHSFAAEVFWVGFDYNR